MQVEQTKEKKKLRERERYCEKEQANEKWRTQAHVENSDHLWQRNQKEKLPTSFKGK